MVLFTPRSARTQVDNSAKSQSRSTNTGQFGYLVLHNLAFLFLFFLKVVKLF